LRIEGVDKVPDEIEIRGEVYMNIDEFERINKERQKRGEPVLQTREMQHQALCVNLILLSQPEENFIWHAMELVTILE